MIERSLVFIKPGNFERALEIFSCLDDSLSRFIRTIPVHLYDVPEGIIRKHYAHIPEEIKEPTIQAFLQGDIILCTYTGDNIIRDIRTIVGHTDPAKAMPWTIRGRFSNDSMESSSRERRYLNNVIHASASKEEAEKELELWKEYIE